MIHLLKFNENVTQAKSLLKKLNIKETDSDFQKIRSMLNGHDGYVYWFTKLRFQQNQEFDELSNIWNIISSSSGLISFFTKKIVDIENVEEFWDQYESAKLVSNAKKVLIQFPSRQKSFFSLKEQKDLDILILLSKSKSLPALIKKISSFRDKTSLLEAIDRLLNSTHSGKFDELLTTIESSGATIHTSDIENNIIICQVNYEQIRKLGGDTSWCIVRSESTFKSYANGGLQWIIFLVDNFGKNERLSKIGLTTHFSYTTAHDKFDGYISKENLSKILSERDFNLPELYLSKEKLLNISDWSNISVENLIEIGIDKATIIDRKTLFRDKTKYNRSAPLKNDIEFFDELEIDEFNLHNKLEITWNNLKTLNINNILNKDLLSRLDYPISFITFTSLKPTKEQVIKYKIYDNKKINCSISDIFTVDGFTKDDIIENKIYTNVLANCSKCISFFTKEELIRYNILSRASNITIDALINKGFDKKDIINNYSNNLDTLSKNSIDFFKGKTTKGVIERLHSTFWSDDRAKLGISDVETYKVKLLIMSLYDINISKIKFTSKGHSNSLKDIISGVPISKDYINKLYELGFKITNSEEFEVYLNILSISNNNILYRIRDINKLRGIFKDDDVVRTLCTEKIKNSLHSKMYSNYFELIDVKNELKDSDEWIAILDSLRSQTSLYDLRTKKSKQDSGYNSYSFTNTVEYFNELKCDKSYIEKMGGVGKFTNNVFEGSKVDDILSFFKSNGYTINREIELEIIENSINRAYKNEKYLDKDGKENTKKVYSEEYYQRLLDRNINIEESLEHILEYIRTRIEITDSEISKYKEIFNKGESKWISILDNEFKIIRHTQFKYSAIKELSRRNIYDVSNYKDWYNKYFDIYPTIENKIHRWDKFENDLKVLYIIASLDKFNEVDKLNINFDITTDNMRGFSFDDNKFHSISKLLCRTGSDYDRNFKDFNLPSHKLKMIYEWILSKVDMKEVTVNKYLLVCHYIYNKDIYLKCLIDFKRKRRGILRVSLYRYILLFFAKNNNIIEYKKILNDLFSLVDSDIKNTKMLPIEYKKTINYLDSIGNRDFSKLVDPYLLEIKSKYDRILNESIITKFKYFR